jgi:hypothetical protein
MIARTEEQEEVEHGLPKSLFPRKHACGAHLVVALPIKRRAEGGGCRILSDRKIGLRPRFKELLWLEKAQCERVGEISILYMIAARRAPILCQVGPGPSQLTHLPFWTQSS